MLQPYFAMHDPHIYPLDAVALDLTEEGFSPTQTEQSVSTRFQEGYAAICLPQGVQLRLLIWSERVLPLQMRQLL